MSVHPLKQLYAQQVLLLMQKYLIILVALRWILSNS